MSNSVLRDPSAPTPQIVPTPGPQQFSQPLPSYPWSSSGCGGPGLSGFCLLNRIEQNMIMIYQGWVNVNLTIFLLK